MIVTNFIFFGFAKFGVSRRKGKGKGKISIREGKGKGKIFTGLQNGASLKYIKHIKPVYAKKN